MIGWFFEEHLCLFAFFEEHLCLFAFLRNNCVCLVLLG